MIRVLFSSIHSKNYHQSEDCHLKKYRPRESMAFLHFERKSAQDVNAEHVEDGADDYFIDWVKHSRKEEK